MPGQPVHIEIPADDTAKGREFWGALFGWQFESFPGPFEYHMARITDQAGAALPGGGARAGANVRRATIAPMVLRLTEGGRRASFLVILASQADVRGSAGLPTKDAKGAFVYRTLQSWADRTQAPIVAVLD